MEKCPYLKGTSKCPVMSADSKDCPILGEFKSKCPYFKRLQSEECPIKKCPYLLALLHKDKKE